MPANQYLLQMAKQALEKRAFIPAAGAGGAPPADGSAPPGQAPPQDPAAVGGPPGTPGAPAGAPPPAAAPPPTDPAAGGAPPAAVPGVSPEIQAMIQSAVQQATGGQGGGGAKGKGGAGKHDEVAHQLYKNNQLMIGIANQLGVQLPNESMLGLPPGQDPSAMMAGGPLAPQGQDPNAAPPAQDPAAAPQPAPPINFAPGVAAPQQKLAEELIARIGTPIDEPPLIPVQVQIPLLDVVAHQSKMRLEKQASDLSLAEENSLAPVSARAQALLALMAARGRRK